ncbi:uncharacterized protein LOC125861485 [Solanum stenotomum]|uniref:uncharacterized protein LOC125861485 n=1 Tax=Solanum stenotomum TaxID=172797 RepID=UPI0020D0FD0A|nr:uncharacterized protein LOC125861485 [Solanum stenotomum]
MFGRSEQSIKRRKGRKASSVQDFLGIFEGLRQGFDPNEVQGMTNLVLEPRVQDFYSVYRVLLIGVKRGTYIIPSRIVVRGHLARRNVDPQYQGIPNAPQVKAQGEVTNGELRNVIRMLNQVVTNQAGQQRGNRQDVADTSRIREFFRLNSPYFTGSSVNEDSKNFAKQLHKGFEVMHVVDVERVGIATYQLKVVARVWYDQWKKSTAEGEPIVSWAVFEEAFMGHLFPRALREAKKNGPAPSSSIALAPRKRDKFRNQNSQKFRARPSQSQGSVVQGANWTPTCAKFGRNHPGECYDGSDGCFNCGETIHFIRECPKNRQGSGNGGNGGQSSSVALPGRAAPRRATSGIGGAANHLYAITSSQEQIIHLTLSLV